MKKRWQGARIVAERPTFAALQAPDLPSLGRRGSGAPLPEGAPFSDSHKSAVWAGRVPGAGKTELSRQGGAPGHGRPTRPSAVDKRARLEDFELLRTQPLTSNAPTQRYTQTHTSSLRSFCPGCGVHSRRSKLRNKDGALRAVLRVLSGAEKLG